ncbi:sterol carrier protein domain-containing protein, partial [Bacillus cereus]|uniref:sterol carrier protein domain-containing protein n=1 Tax=Bacillus cereus TaxID=1396 RepID=UPI0020C08CC5
MATIVDVKEFLLPYPFLSQDFELQLAVSDRVVAWNIGTFIIKIKDGNLSVQKVSETLNDNAVHLTVQTLATMLLSYKRPK